MNFEMFKRKLGKKGTILDVMVVLIAFSFIIAVSSVVVFTFYNEFYETAYPILNDTTSQEALDMAHDAAPAFDYIFIAAMMGLMIVGYVFAFLTRESAVFIWFNILIIMVLLLMAVIVSNSYETIMNQSLLNVTSQSFPLQNTLISNLPLITFIASLGMILVMFIVGGRNEGI